MKHRYNCLRSFRMFFAGIVALTAPVLFIAAPVSFAGETALHCDIQNTSCITKTRDGVQIDFDIKPKPVTSMTDNTFVVVVSKNDKPLTEASVQLDLSMPNMFMGKNQPVMKQVKSGRYEGNGIIPKCASGKKTWQAEITVRTSGETVLAAFVFEVK
jgi:hypothetical protein